MEYRLTNIDDNLWRKVKKLAALKEMTIRELILFLLEQEIRKYSKVLNIK